MASPPRWIWVPANLHHDWSSAVDHEVKPSVVPGHGESLVGNVGADPDPDQAHAGWGHNTATDHSGTAVIRKIIV